MTKLPSKSGGAPITAINQQLMQPLTRKSLADISDISERASQIITEVRDNMTDPLPRKKSPSYTTAQICSLCEIDRARLNYLVTRGGVPAGERHGNGRTRTFSTKDALKWVQKVSPHSKRPKNQHALVVTIGNFKGGVSKTTCVMTLAQALTLRGRRVLVIDLDPQASLTSLFGVLADTEIHPDSTALPLLEGDEDNIRYAVQETYWPNLHLVPACAALFNAEFSLPAQQNNDPRNFEFWNVLNKGLESVRNPVAMQEHREWIDAEIQRCAASEDLVDHLEVLKSEKEKWAEDYDVILIDTPPSLSYTTINAFMCADGLIIPMPPAPLDYTSSSQFWSLFSDFSNDMSKLRPNLNKVFEFINVLITKVDPSKTVTPIYRNLIRQTYGDMVLSSEIHMSNVTSVASAEFGTLYDIERYEGSQETYNRARKAYDALAQEIDNQLLNIWQIRELGGV